MSEEEMYKLNQPEAVVPESVGADHTQTSTISIEEDAPASLAGRSATRLLEENREMDAVVPERGGPSTRTGKMAREGDELVADSRRLSEEGWRQTATINFGRLLEENGEMDAVVPERGGPSTRTGTMAREGDELVADSRRLSEEGWRQTATTNIDASETDSGKRCFQSPGGGISLVSPAYSRIMRPPEQELLFSERDRAGRINFFERMAWTGNPVVEDAAGLSEYFMTLRLAGEERVTEGLARSLAEEMQREGKTLESLEQKATMASTLIYPRDYPKYPLDEDRNGLANTKTKPEKEDVLARGSTLLQTAAREPALLDFEVEVPPSGSFHSDMTAMWARCNFSRPIEPFNGASAETGEPSSPSSPREPEDEEATLARLINSPARQIGLAIATHMELAQQDLQAARGLTNSPQMPGGLANATHMELSQEFVQAMETVNISSSNAGVGEQEEQAQEFVQAMETMNISSSNAGVGEQEEQVQEQINERSSPRAPRFRSQERYRPYSREARPLHTPSPDRMRRERYYSMDPSTSQFMDPTQIASSSSRGESPGRRALEADGFFSTRRNVRRHRRRRANAELLDNCSSKEKILESD